MFFWWICGGESVLPVLLLCHLGSSSHIKHFFPVKFNISVPVSGFKTISYCNHFYEWLAFFRQKIIWGTFLFPWCFVQSLREHIHFSSAASFQELESRGCDLCYTLWSLFSPLLPRMLSLRTGADCLCLGPGKVAEGKYVRRRGQLFWDRSQDPSLWLLSGTRQGCSINHLTRLSSLPALRQGSGLFPPCLNFVFMRINDEGFAAF